jgi:two-component system CheB/CheR fusion protein
VRQELRDRVVFAPQNVLQDPPFSRLDIATCRNLLIYLEPEVQQRVLSLIHFGLREGGTLFLGTSETIAGAEDLFEPIDKKSRIFRRVGASRQGTIEFPLPHALDSNDPNGRGRFRERRHESVRLSLNQLTQQTLVEHRCPAAVTLDRDHRVLYFHGDTRPYLLQPTGEPTRDLMLLVREGIRGAVRVALSRAAIDNAPVTLTDGSVDIDPLRRLRVAVTASPLTTDGAAGANSSEYFVVSFAERGEISLASAPAASSRRRTSCAGSAPSCKARSRSCRPATKSSRLPTKR